MEIELNGRLGLVLASENDGHRAALSFVVGDGRITRIDAVRNPEKLRRIGPKAVSSGLRTSWRRRSVFQGPLVSAVGSVSIAPDGHLSVRHPFAIRATAEADVGADRQWLDVVGASGPEDTVAMALTVHAPRETPAHSWHTARSPWRLRV